MKNTKLITAGLILLLVSCVYAQEPEQTAQKILEGIGSSCKDTSTNCDSSSRAITQKLDSVLAKMRADISKEINNAFNKFIMLILIVQVGLWAASQILNQYERYIFERKYARNYDILTRTGNDIKQLNTAIKEFRHDYGFIYKEELCFFKPRKWYHKLLGIRPQERRTVHHFAKQGGTGLKITQGKDLVKPLVCQYCGRVCLSIAGKVNHEKKCKNEVKNE